MAIFQFVTSTNQHFPVLTIWQKESVDLSNCNFSICLIDKLTFSTIWPNETFKMWNWIISIRHIDNLTLSSFNDWTKWQCQFVKLILWNLTNWRRDEVSTIWQNESVNRWIWHYATWQNETANRRNWHFSICQLSSFHELTIWKFQVVQLKLWNLSNWQIDTLKLPRFDQMKLCFFFQHSDCADSTRFFSRIVLSRRPITPTNWTAVL